MSLSFVSLVSKRLYAGIQAKLGDVFVIHDDQPFVSVLDESDVGFDEARLGFVVTQAGTRIESADVIERLLHGFHGATQGAPDFLKLLVLHGAQMLIDDGDGVRKRLGGGFSVAVLVQFELQLVVTQLIE